MWGWIFGSFAGWLFRKQLVILLNIGVFLTRTAYALIKLLPKGKLKWLPRQPDAPQKPVLDEPAREAGCKQVVTDFVQLFGYMTREAMDKKELEAKIYTQKVTPLELATELHKRIAVTACNRNGPGLQSARLRAHITCLYPAPRAHISCL